MNFYQCILNQIPTHFKGIRSAIRPPNDFRSGGSRKREFLKPTGIKCFLCGNTGHRRVDCPKRFKENVKVPPPTTTATNDKSVRPPITCTFCKKVGHNVDSCFVRQRSETNNTRTNTINFCKEVDKLVGKGNVLPAVIQNVPVDVLIDSGSEISLISHSVLKYLNYSAYPTYRVMRGIGSQEIESTSSVNLVIEFPEIALEVSLFVVSSDCISVPVLIGTDILNRAGITYIRTNEVQRLIRTARSGVNATWVMDSASINTILTGTDKQRLLSLIGEFSHAFVSGTATSTVTTGSMEIRLTSDVPVHYRPYKMSADEKERVRGIIEDLMAKGIVRESQSEYASPVILVKKKDGADRMCVDYRALNAITVKDRYPLPLIDDHIDKLGTNTYFSSLDMASGFHQIKMREDDGSIGRTAFVTPEGHFEYLKMPYGLANAPVVYQRIISKTLKALIDTGKVLTYIDDILVLSETIDEGFTILRRVLETLVTAGFSLNPKKCTFLSTEVEYLGRLISKGQVRPSARKVDALLKSPKPSNVKQVRQFLGLAGYFRRYIANYAVKTAPIAKLTKNNVPFA